MRTSTLLLALIVAASQVPSPAVPREKTWGFGCAVENRSGHEIHVRFLESGAELGEVTVPPTDDQRPGSTWCLRLTGFRLRDSARDLEIEETNVLKMRRVFRVLGFKDHPEKDFRLVVSAGGMDLTQDRETGDSADSLGVPPGKLREHMASARTDEPTTGLFVFNDTGHEVLVRVSVDGQLVAERHLDATWEQALARAGKDPKWAYLEADANNSAVPRVVVPAVISFAGKTLTVEETLLLKATTTFDLQSAFKKRAGSQVILHVASDAIRLTTGTPEH